MTMAMVSTKRFSFRDNIFELVQCANKRKYSVIIVTNQSELEEGTMKKMILRN